MALSPRLDLRQSQTLVMTPQLQQAIRLLQLSNLELNAYVDTQLEQNPLLERDEQEHGGGDNGFATAAEGEPSGALGALSTVDAALGDASGEASQAALDVDYDNLFDGDGGGGTGGEPLSGLTFDGASVNGGGDRRSSSAAFDEAGELEGTLSERRTLRDHLREQLACDIQDPADRIIAAYMIEDLDEAGYLRSDLNDLAATLGCDLARVEKALARLQQFDPPGIFARDLRECLLLQLIDRGPVDDAMRLLIAHLDLAGRRDFAALERLCGVPAAEILDMLAELRSLNPKPATDFEHFLPQPVTPDVLMRRDPGGGWLVELNSETLPRVLVNNQYYARVCRSTLKKDEKTYINECFQAANWLVKSLHQRATTILKVASEIVRQQNGFFHVGVQALRPLVLRDIAEAVELHESTVSRVTSNKFMATPRGIVELKYFFSQAIGSCDGSGDALSAEWVRQRIRQLIEAEPAERTLSDDALVDMLGKEGIEIARRTVAKYREAMGIPSSVQRRRARAVGY